MSVEGLAADFLSLFGTVVSAAANTLRKKPTGADQKSAVKTVAPRRATVADAKLSADMRKELKALQAALEKHFSQPLSAPSHPREGRYVSVAEIKGKPLPRAKKAPNRTILLRGRQTLLRNEIEAFLTKPDTRNQAVFDAVRSWLSAPLIEKLKGKVPGLTFQEDQYNPKYATLLSITEDALQPMLLAILQLIPAPIHDDKKKAAVAAPKRPSSSATSTAPAGARPHTAASRLSRTTAAPPTRPATAAKTTVRTSPASPISGTATPPGTQPSAKPQRTPYATGTPAAGHASGRSGFHSHVPPSRIAGKASIPSHAGAAKARIGTPIARATPS